VIDPRLVEAKRHLDRLHLYPKPVDISRVRIVVVDDDVNYNGYVLSPRRIYLHPKCEQDEAFAFMVIAHELTHVWQMQHYGWLRTLWKDYKDRRRMGLLNPLELEACAATPRPKRLSHERVPATVERAS
jgi:hypothetical protein